MALYGVYAIFPKVGAPLNEYSNVGKIVIVADTAIGIKRGYASLIQTTHKLHLLNEECFVSIQILLNVIPKVLINNATVLTQVMDRYLAGY